MLVYLIRVLWLAAVIFAIAAGADMEMRRYRGWGAYLAASCCLGVLGWVELIVGIETLMDSLWPAMLVVLICRGVAMLEALHYQTCRFPYWSRMMLGVFLLVSGLVLAVAVWRHAMPTSVLDGNTLRDQFIRFRRYGQLWIGLVALLTTAFYFGVRRGKHNAADSHALVVGLMSLNYAAVGLLDMTVVRSGYFVEWEQGISYSLDTALLIYWAIRVGPLLCGSAPLCHRKGPRTPSPTAPDADAFVAPPLRLPRGQFFRGTDTGRWRDNILQ